MSTAKTFRPRVGMRFQMRGSEFEVCFAEAGVVRYASVNGGSPCRVTFNDFLELQKKEEVSILKPDLYREQLVAECDCGFHALTSLTDEELRRGMRRVRYAEAATAELLHPNSFKEISAWIPCFAAQVNDANPPAPRTVSSWVKALRVDGQNVLLTGEKLRGNRSLRFSPEIHLLTLEAVDEFLEHKERRDARDVMARIAGRLAEKGLLTKDGEKVKTPSESTIRRLLKKIDPYLLTRIKQGALAAEKAARAAGKSITSPRPLYLVQIDTHYLKVFVVDPETGEILGKPYLVCAFDVRTRCVVGIYISLMPPSTATTLGVARDMLSRPGDGLPGGIPIFLIPDNGIEFKNSGVERVSAKLFIHFEPAMVRDPNGKAHVEVFFRTLSNYLIQKLPGTTFSNPEKRGEYKSEKEASATLEQIEKYVRFWVENEYHQRPHSGTGRIPIRMWEEETAEALPKGLTKEDVDVLVRTPYRCSINGGRVRVEKNMYYSHALRTLEGLHKGRVTVLLNELDLGCVYIEHPFEKATLIQADSIDPEYARGLTLSEHRAAQEVKKRMTKSDLRAIGKNANLLARWQLLQMIQKDCKVARSKIAKLTQGKGRLTYGSGVKSGPADDETIAPSAVEQPLNQHRQQATGIHRLGNMQDPRSEDTPNQVGNIVDIKTNKSTIFRME